MVDVVFLGISNLQTCTGLVFEMGRTLRLGHRSISTTLALYAQGTEQGHVDAANATAKYLRPEDDNIYLIRAD